MARKPPGRGWIHREALQYDCVDHHAIEDGAVIGIKISNDAIDLSKLTSELRELIEQIPGILERLEAPTCTIKPDFSAMAEEPPKRKRGRPKAAPESAPESGLEEAP